MHAKFTNLRKIKSRLSGIMEGVFDTEKNAVKNEILVM